MRRNNDSVLTTMIYLTVSALLLRSLARRSWPRVQDNAPEIITIKTHPDERAYRKSINRFSWISNFLLGITAVVTASAAYYAGESAFEAARQANAADQASRPWLQAEKAEVYNLTSGDERNDAISGNYRVTTKNVGQSPALRSRVFSRLTFAGEAPELTYCNKNGANPTYTEAVIFPQSKIDLVGAVLESNRSVERAIIKLVNLDSSLGPPQEARKRTPFGIEGCIIYQDSFGDWHVSRFGFDLGQTDLRPGSSLKKSTASVPTEQIGDWFAD